MFDKGRTRLIASLMHETFEDFGSDGVYVISVASRLADMHPNTLRKYESVGLLSPDRTLGRQRLYSNEDIERLKLIRSLIDNYNLTTEVLGVLLGMVRTLVTVDTELNREPELANLPVAQKLSKLIRKCLKSANLYGSYGK